MFAHILKRNPYHDNKGRFTSKDKVGSAAPKSMADYNARFDDPDVTSVKVLSKFTEAERGEIKLMTLKAEREKTSKQLFSDGKGNYDAERLKLHNEIINKILSPEEIDRATPPDGTAPTFVVLGGRGGSGKSHFTEEKGKVKEFDASKFIVLDSDAIKAQLKPPYKGWNAFSVHDESSDIFDLITEKAKAMGLNLVHDATLKSDNVKRTIEAMKSDGYNIEGHYMYVPRQEAASRAVGRYLGRERDPKKRGRLVPVDVVLQNTRNEANFDSLKPYFSKWSAYDNQGDEPKLIARSKA